MSFVINVALDIAGVHDPRQKAVVEAAIPEVRAIVDLVTKNMSTVNAAVALINQILPHLQKAAPGVQILVDAVDGPSKFSIKIG